MMQRRWWMGLLVLMMVFAAGCGAASDATTGHEDHKAHEEAADFPVKVKDDTGKTVTIKKQPKRIVSLIPSMTETIFAVGQGDKVVGVTANDDYPAEVKKLPKVGDMNINAEKVLSLKPDLVLASPMVKQETLDKLRKLGLTVIAYEPTNLEGIYKQIEDVGKATGAEAKANHVVDEMKKDEALAKEVAAKVPAKKKVKVWIEVSPDLYTTGQGTYMDEMVTLAGGENVAHDQKSWVQLSAEKVVKYNPDVILYTYGGKASQISDRKSWKSVAAVKDHRIQGLDSNTTSRPGPRVTEALLDISKTLYPDTYAKVAK
ncbi:ABC transporter substrate-binding protein [Marininema halotolerans]|uniref:Iron complex transport system substrate-binding protein n=1 Tax=Marininema halotolerans TaxID=1155944 RepID=A0A1I6SIG6_9BACL|nr:ABC transporter substrate-binding protein [Marininema halotolerans]SFS76765.1 iron complex transport system substrate-binding protein [Marininema halotolerans]